MCSDPQTNLKTGDQFSCRRCDECISQRRFDWVSRAMAERSTSAQTICLTLTYNNETQENRDGAKMFRYSDVRDFVKRVRRAIHYRTGQHGSLRFIVAGEQGDRFGRCHWHCVLFSQVDLTSLGEITDPSTGQSARDFVTGSGQRVKRVHWSLWGRGFVTFQEPDEGGMHYALTYALKDQFSAQKAKGTGRETKSEVFATGLFRQSKFPPIGQDFLDQLIDRLAHAGAVLPSTNIRVPDLRGYWRPSGHLRKYLLTRLKDLNDNYRQEHGRNAPQWSSLLSSCAKSETDMELLNGEAEESESDEDFIRRKRAQAADDFAQQRKHKTRNRCGSKAPCDACIRGGEGFGPYRAFEAFTDEFRQVRYRYAEGDPTGARLRSDQRSPQGSLQALCQKGPDDPQIYEAFGDQSAPQSGFAASSCAR